MKYSKIQEHQPVKIHNQVNSTPLNLGVIENSFALRFNYFICKLHY